jgi:hypothetical protein
MVNDYSIVGFSFIVVSVSFITHFLNENGKLAKLERTYRARHRNGRLLEQPRGGKYVLKATEVFAQGWSHREYVVFKK